MSDAAQFYLPAVREPPAFGAIVPAIVADTHRDAAERFIEFFAATLRNANTRAAHMNAVADFLAFASVAALGSLAEVRPRLGVDIRRRACGAAGADDRWSVA